MEWAWRVEVQATRRSLAGVASCAGDRGGCAVTRAAAGSRGRSTCVSYRGTEGKVCWLQGPARVGSTRPRHRTVAPWGEQRLGISPGAAVSRGSVARQCARSGAALDAAGGGRPNTSGTMGSGARNIVANRSGKSRLRWRAVRTTLARTCLGVGALAGAVAAAHLADDDGGPDGLFGAPVGGVDRRVPQEREDGRGNWLARCAAKRSASSSAGGLSISRLSRASSRPRAVARPWSLRAPALRRSRSARPCPQGVLYLTGPLAVGMVFEQMLTSSKQVGRIPISE